jgi:NADP-dependent 3-hydroxy acid dehydrogenase YdfG
MTTSKIAFVTGASSGIGKACATALLNDGWQVVFVGRRAELLDRPSPKPAQPVRAASPCPATSPMKTPSPRSSNP